MPQQNKSIIFYLHLHKCGGTTINTLFKNYNKHKPNTNGNPWCKSNKKIIKFWNYNKNEFNAFKKRLNSQNINFVAFEWNFFKHYNSIDLNNIELVVCIREPYKRYISNMKMDNCHNMTSYNKKNVIWRRDRSVQTFNVNYNKYNYYVKMLNGFGDKPNIEINRKHLEIAKKNLEKFSTILILENKDTFKLLEKYDIYNIAHNNQGSQSNKKIVSNFEKFKKYNTYDYELYNYAIELSRKKLEQLNAVNE